MPWVMFILCFLLNSIVTIETNARLPPDWRSTKLVRGAALLISRYGCSFNDVADRAA